MSKFIIKLFIDSESVYLKGISMMGVLNNSPKAASRLLNNVSVTLTRSTILLL